MSDCGVIKLPVALDPGGSKGAPGPSLVLSEPERPSALRQAALNAWLFKAASSVQE